MIDSVEQHSRLCSAWRVDLLRALGGDVPDELAPVLEGVVRCRAILALLGELARGATQPDAPVFREQTAQAVVRMARYLRLLGFMRHDVHRLDLGRRRRPAC